MISQKVAIAHLAIGIHSKVTHHVVATNVLWCRKCPSTGKYKNMKFFRSCFINYSFWHLDSVYVLNTY